MNNKARKAQLYLVVFLFLFFTTTVAGIPTVVGVPNVVPVTVVSVQKEVTWVNTSEGPIISPAGPSVNITLKSDSDVPIINLSATLMTSDFDSFYLIANRRAFTFEFPYIPVNQTVWRRLVIFSAFFENNTTYPLIINGTLQNGKAFSYVYPMMINYSAMPFPSLASLYSVSPPVMKGDVNGDGQVTVVDALFVAQYTVGLMTLNTQQLAAADVNGDGQVTVADALFIAQYTVGLRQL